MSDTSFTRPTLETLISRTRADVLSRLATDDVLRHSDAEVLARVEAGVVHGLYGYLDYLATQLLPDKATDWLERHGSLWGKPRKAASKAAGSATMTTVSGAVISVDTLLYSASNIQYTVTEEAEATGASLVIAVEAVVAGEAGNLASGAPLSLVSPVDGVQTQGVSGTISGGSDQELLEDYRSRILLRIRETPQGGCANDYVQWALEVDGVTRAWCYPEELGEGTVTVRFVRDDDADLIPDANEVATVAAHIKTLCPVTAHVAAVAPIAAPLVFQISGLSPSTSTVRSAVETSLRALLVAEAEPGETLLLSHIREAISTAAGEYNHVLVSPAADVTHSTGLLATFGGITWL